MTVVRRRGRRGRRRRLGPSRRRVGTPSSATTRQPRRTTRGAPRPASHATVPRGAAGAHPDLRVAGQPRAGRRARRAVRRADRRLRQRLAGVAARRRARRRSPSSGGCTRSPAIERPAGVDTYERVLRRSPWPLATGDAPPAAARVAVGRARGVRRLRRRGRAGHARRRASPRSLGIAPDASGLVDHQSDRRRVGAHRRPRLDHRRACSPSSSARPLARRADGCARPPRHVGGGARRRARRRARRGWRRTPWAPQRSAPASGYGQRVLGEPADVGALERVGLELAADGPAVEHERVERDAGEAEAQAVEHGDEPDRLDLDAGLLLAPPSPPPPTPSSRRRPNPVGYSHTPESARCTSRISPSSLPTTAPTATFGVT